MSRDENACRWAVASPHAIALFRPRGGRQSPCPRATASLPPGVTVHACDALDPKMPARGRRRACTRAGRGGGGANRIRGGGDGHGRVFKVLCLVGLVRSRNRSGRTTDGARSAYGGKRAGCCCCAGGAGRPQGEQKRKAQKAQGPSRGRRGHGTETDGRTRAHPPPPPPPPVLCAAPRAHACM